MKGVILAAGKGSRLFPVTQRIPKPLLPLANRPTMAYAFDRLIEMGITDICVIVGDNEDVMKQALGTGSEFGVSLTFARQMEPKGLAHALGFAKTFCGQDAFCMYLGDAIYSDSLAPFCARFKESGCANLNLVKSVEDPSRFGVANVDGERIVKLVEKPANPESNLAMAGLYFFGPEIWTVLDDLKPSARGEFEITDAIQLLIDRDETVLAGVYEGEWFDTGTLDSFLATSSFLVQGRSRIDGEVLGEVGPGVVVGSGAVVTCRRIEDTVVLPGVQVTSEGLIIHSIIGEDIVATEIADAIV
ncbi:MAG: sugar phosphate nucleotidyltransferase [Fimbriimonadaceae bacterium]